MNSSNRIVIIVLSICTTLIFTANAGSDSKPAPLFNGKDLTGWKTAGGKGVNQWTVGKASLDTAKPSKLSVEKHGSELISAEPGANLASEQAFSDCIVELEFMIPAGSNSGIKMMRIYEIQILDSAAKKNVDAGDCGAIYKESAPKVNACKKPGEWQQLLIDFRAPKFDAAGKKTSNAKFVRVLLNGQLVQDNVEVAHGTNVDPNTPEYPTGPVFFQGDHGPVAFRNIKVTPLN
jgi:hypothetical protein